MVVESSYNLLKIKLFTGHESARAARVTKSGRESGGRGAVMKLCSSLILLVAIAANAQWERVNGATTSSFRGLSVVNKNVIWASGSDGTVMHTTDGGKNWLLITVAGAEKLDFRGIRAFDEKTAVIISSGPAERDQARIYRTVDGGKTWQKVFEEKRAGIFFDAVAFWDRKHGIVL